MGPRLGFVLSLLAACGIHAVVLLVPRAAITEEAPIPTVELDLVAAPVIEEAAPTPRKIAPGIEKTASPVTHQGAPPLTDSPGPAAAAPSFEQPPPSPPTTSEPTEAPVSQGLEALSASGNDSSVAGPAAEDSNASADAGSAQSAGGAAAVIGAAAATVSTLIPPRPLAEILPTYPLSARRSGLEGVVKVIAMVDTSGTVTSAEVLTSSGHASLDQAALEAVRRALFSPALQDGKTVPCRIVIPIRFQLSAAAHG